MEKKNILVNKLFSVFTKEFYVKQTKIIVLMRLMIKYMTGVVTLLIMFFNCYSTYKKIFWKKNILNNKLFSVFEDDMRMIMKWMTNVFDIAYNVFLIFIQFIKIFLKKKKYIS